MQKKFLQATLAPLFFLREDVCLIAKELLGKVLVTEIDGKITAGIITETEAYAGVKDKASHAYGGKITPRNKVMYEQGGHAYVYMCYGIHYLFNVVTNKENIPDAVLIRAIEPYYGKEIMAERLIKKKMKPYPVIGPGKVSVALGITLKHNGLTLFEPPIYITDSGIQVLKKDIITTTRVGIDYAGEDALLPYRFILKKTSF